MIRKLTRRASLVALVFVMAAGCGTNSEKTQDKPNPKTPPEVALKAVTHEKLKAAIAGHKGKVVVLDVWATFCPPCMKEFPHLVELHQKYGEDGLVCVSLSVDEVEDEAKALAFLKKHNATFPNYRLDEKDWAEALGFGAIPVVIVYDREGKPKTFDEGPKGPFSYADDIEPYVRGLLKK